MKIIVLTGDILDGVIISQRVIRAGKDVRAIIYEQKKQTLKMFLKRLLFLLLGKIRYVTYKDMVKEKKDLFVKKVDNINSDAVRSILEGIKPDLIAVIGTRKLKKEIFGIAKLGAINMHSGILPFYRGADTEFWALYNGQKDKIGVSIHFIDEKLDSGDVILQARQKVLLSDNYKTLRMKNIMLGADKMVEAIGLIESGKYERIKQNESEGATYKSITPEYIKAYKRKMQNV